MTGRAGAVGIERDGAHRISIPPATNAAMIEKYFAFASRSGLDRFQRMISSGMKEVADLKRYSSPTVTPQALAWDRKALGMRNSDCGILGSWFPDSSSLHQAR